jgi:hypothetical protein
MASSCLGSGDNLILTLASQCAYIQTDLDWVGPSLLNNLNNIYKNSVRTAKKTQHFTVKKINRLMLFKEIIAVYCENRTKQINTKLRVIRC